MAAGNITAAADAMESGLARGLSLVISFLAQLLHLSGIEAKLKEFPQFEFDDRMYDRAEIGKFKAEASGVQRLIDDALKKIEQRTPNPFKRANEMILL
jgi:hypothetical protein